MITCCAEKVPLSRENFHQTWKNTAEQADPTAETVCGKQNGKVARESTPASNPFESIEGFAGSGKTPPAANSPSLC